jgi:hypothetical protein
VELRHRDWDSARHLARQPSAGPLGFTDATSKVVAACGEAATATATKIAAMNLKVIVRI